MIIFCFHNDGVTKDISRILNILMSVNYAHAIATHIRTIMTELNPGVPSRLPT